MELLWEEIIQTRRKMCVGGENDSINESDYHSLVQFNRPSVLLIIN